MRTSTVALSVAACLVQSAAAAQPQIESNPDGTVNPIVPAAIGDYREARSSSRTNLRNPGPSPQRIPMPTAPSDAQQIGFSSSGLSLTAWLGGPANSQPRMPVVIFIHGGFGFGREDFDMARPFRNAGYLVAAPILRGENGQAGSFSLFYDEVDDVIALADHLRRQAFVDPDRIYLSGHSSGGTIALLAGMTDRRFRAVTSLSASPDQALFVKYGIRPSDVPFEPSDIREVQMRSPLSYAASLKSPTRIFFGSEEGVFKLSSNRVAAIAAAASLDVRAVEVPGTHMSAVPKEIENSIQFFKSQ